MLKCCAHLCWTATCAHLGSEPRETVFSQNHPLSSSQPRIEPTLNFQKIFIGSPHRLSRHLVSQDVNFHNISRQELFCAGWKQVGDIYHFLNRNGKQEKKRKERGRNLWEQVYITIYHFSAFIPFILIVAFNINTFVTIHRRQKLSPRLRNSRSQSINHQAARQSYVLFAILVVFGFCHIPRFILGIVGLSYYIAIFI